MIATPNEAPFPREEFERRLANVRRRMAERGLRIFLTHTPENIYYLTGYQDPRLLHVPDLDRPRGAGAHHPDPPHRGGQRGGRLVDQNRATYQDTQDPAEATYRVLAEADLTGGPIGVERDSWFLSINQYERLRKLLGPNGRLLDASGLVEGLRVVKSDAEIALVRKAAVVADAGTRAGIEAIAEGRTEREVAAVTNAALIREGGEYMGLPTFMGSGPRVDLTHATWTDRRLEKGDSMFIELSGNVQTVQRRVVPYRPFRERPTQGASQSSGRRRCRPQRRYRGHSARRHRPRCGQSQQGGLRQVRVQPRQAHRLLHRHQLSARLGGGKRPKPTGGRRAGAGAGNGVPRAIHGEQLQALRTAGASSLGAGPPVFAAVSETILVTATGREVLTNCPPRDLILKG